MTEQWKTLASVTSQDVVDALTSAYRMGLNAGLANKLTEGTFEWAMQQMRQGKAVARRGSAMLLRVANGRIQSFIRHADKPDWQDDFNVAVMDVLATDWEIVPEPKTEPEGHDFMWAVQQMRQGRRVRRKGWGMWPALIRGQFVSVVDVDQKDWTLEPEGESR